MKPGRIQRKRSRGWRMPPGAIYVGRPTKWGNPVRRGAAKPDTLLYLYEQHVLKRVRAGALDLGELSGKTLVCWCKPGDPCHADVLLRLANPTEVAMKAGARTIATDISDLELMGVVCGILEEAGAVDPALKLRFASDLAARVDRLAHIESRVLTMRMVLCICRLEVEALEGALRMLETPILSPGGSA